MAAWTDDPQVHRRTGLAAQVVQNFGTAEVCNGDAVNALDDAAGRQARPRRRGARQGGHHLAAGLDLDANAGVTPGIDLVEATKLGRGQIARIGILRGDHRGDGGLDELGVGGRVRRPCSDRVESIAEDT